MRGRLAELEPRILALWDEMDLFARQREESRGRGTYILHDGPPYANGKPHIGTALNKILKDIINRTRQTLGADAHYIPGWDCHGLPIEWEVEKALRGEGKGKEEADPIAFRRACRDFAWKWIDVQREAFRRYGVVGDWRDPYLTMSGPGRGCYRARAWQVPHERIPLPGHAPGALVGSGANSAGGRGGGVPRARLNKHLGGLSGARTGAQGPRRLGRGRGGHLDDDAVDDPRLAGGRLRRRGPPTACCARPRGAVFLSQRRGRKISPRAGQAGGGPHGRGPGGGGAAGAGGAKADGAAESLEVLAEFPGQALEGTILSHPLAEEARAQGAGAGGYDWPLPMLAASFVTMEQGTGLVHLAPAHGTDDHYLCKAHGISAPPWMDGASRFADAVPLFAGARVQEDDGSEGGADALIIAALEAAGSLAAKAPLAHEYPHSWRSKAPLLFRETSQWFISMEETGLREAALKGIDATAFWPETGRARLEAMVRARPDWCISRQRLWGVPLPLFTHKKTGETLCDGKVIERIAKAYEEADSDLWFSEPAQRWLAPDYDPGGMGAGAGCGGSVVRLRGDPRLRA